MFVEDLYKTVLVDPNIIYEANELFIVSGYASATFTRRHLIELKKK